MASVITDPYYFLSESEISSDVFSSSSSIFYNTNFNDIEPKNNEDSKYDFYSHIQTIHFDEKTLSKLAPHRQASRFLWATSFQISEQSFLFAIFIPMGLILWKSRKHQQQKNSEYECDSEFYEIKPVESQNATFIDCINSRSLIFTYRNEKLLYIIHNIGSSIDDDENDNPNGIDIKTADISDTIRTFCQLSPEKALIVTNGNSAIIFDVPSLTKLKTFSLNFILKINPLRSANICDAIIATTSFFPSEYDDEGSNFVISASYYHLSVFDNADSVNGSFSYKNSISTAIGKPKFMSINGTTAFLIIRNEDKNSDNSSIHFLQLCDIYTKNSTVRNINFDADEEIVSIIAVEKDVCCVLTRYHLHLIIVSYFVFQFSLVISKSQNDFVFTGSLISDHTLSIMTAQGGNHIFEILPYEQLIRLIPYQVNRISVALNLFQVENDKHRSNPEESINYDDSINILSSCNIEDEAFYAMDKYRITSLVHYNHINDFLKLHLDLVKLFYVYKEKYEPEIDFDSITDFEINAYNLICFGEAVSYVGESVSFEFDVLRNAITQRNLQTIFDCVAADIKTRHYNLLDFLIKMANRCYRNHYLHNQEIYRSSVKCHPEVIKLIDQALQSFENYENLIFDHLNQYTKLCSLSFAVFDNDEDNKLAIEYTMRLFNLLTNSSLRPKIIDCIEKVALQHTVIELMARIIHETRLYNEKCNLYYQKFGHNIIKPILIFLLRHEWISDILEIGEIPEWRPYVTKILSNSDSLVLAFNLITEDGSELDRAAKLIWESIKKGISAQTFTVDQAATLCSIAIMCCNVKINENPTRYYNLVQISTQLQNQFLLLQIQKVSQISDKDKVLTAQEMLDYFMSEKEYIFALGVFAASPQERDEEQNASLCAHILALIYTSYSKLNLNDNGFVEIMVQSRALKEIPNGLFEQLENEIQDETSRNNLIKLVNEAHRQTEELQE